MHTVALTGKTSESAHRAIDASSGYDKRQVRTARLRERKVRVINRFHLDFNMFQSFIQRPSFKVFILHLPKYKQSNQQTASYPLANSVDCCRWTGKIVRHRKCNCKILNSSNRHDLGWATITLGQSILLVETCRN